MNSVERNFKLSLGKIFEPLVNPSYENQSLAKKDQNLPVYKIEIYLIDSLNKYMKHCDLLCYNIMNYMKL